jgi:hypothetical protein
MKPTVYYTIEVPFNSITYNGWIEYRGENIGYDWWNSSPVKFQSLEDALNCIKSSENFKDGKWQIVKTVITREVAATN